MKYDEDIVLIAGPTASGKTALAIEIAKSGNGIIINADSMQIYEGLRIITARPTSDEEAEAPHYLFGYKNPAEHFSVAQWLSDVERLLNGFLIEKRQVIFVGGTGLYFNTLLEGLSPMPEIKPEIRTKWRNVKETEVEALHEQLCVLDPAAARTLHPSDRQRIIRALEVFESTGQSITEWQKAKGEPLITTSQRVHKILKMPERSLLHERIIQRFKTMVEQGGVAEVEAFLRRKLDPDLPAMKAIGVPQLAAYLNDEISLIEAVERGQAVTRQYAKRQSTWFRNSFDEGWEIRQ
ncbi:MAG: tRNA (adenosine(37)-N6)-dimethylallyltransferase MiaA [Pseudomonadota bacterium]